MLLATRSVAYPLALVGVPSIVTAIAGSNPLPKGAVTLIFAVWVSTAVAIALARGKHAFPARAFLKAPVLLAFGLLGLMLLRLGASTDQAYGATKVQLYLADNLVFLLGAVFVGTNRSDLRLLLYLVLTVAVLTASLMLVKLLAGSAVAAVGGRFSLSATEYPIYLGRTSAEGLIIAFYAVLAAITVRAHLMAMMAIPLLAAALLAAGSRGPVLALVIGLMTLLALTASNRLIRRRMLLLAGALVATALVVPLVVPGSVITRSLSAVLGDSAHGLSSNGRLVLWSQAYTALEQHPFVGIGTGGFAALSAENPYPHNLFLEVAAELGLVGLAVVIALVGSLIASLISTWRATAGNGRLAAAVVAALFVNALVNALVSGAIQDNFEIWIWGGVGVGMAARLAARRLQAQDEEASLWQAWS